MTTEGRDPAMGPPSDFGWTRCHGCERTFDEQGRGQHGLSCPGVCTRADCDWHGYHKEAP